jgi:hypothetical protein
MAVGTLVRSLRRGEPPDEFIEGHPRPKAPETTQYGQLPERIGVEDFVFIAGANPIPRVSDEGEAEKWLMPT